VAIKTLTLEYDIALLPLNHAYKNIPRGGRALTTLAKEFKELVAFLTYRQFSGQCGVDPEAHWVEAFYTIHSTKALTKPKKSGAYKVNRNKGDIDGQIKLFQDAVCAALGFDDCLITESHSKQVQSDKDRVVVSFHVWGLSTFNAMHF